MHKTPRPALLHDLLAVILKSYGRESVLAALHDLERPVSAPAPRRDERKDSRRKSTAVEILARQDLRNEEASLLIKLAELFDQKRFLPTAGDARLFFNLQGIKDPIPKDRSDVFRKVVPHLLGMTAPALRSIIDESEHAGPSELGPLSDAIKASSAVLRPATKTDPAITAKDHPQDQVQTNQLPDDKV